MNDNIHDLYTKANTLMQGALKKYMEGNIEAADKERKQANELYDMAEKYVNMEAGNQEMIYGENKNFGLIYSIVEANVPKWFVNKKKSKAIGEIKKLISENKVLKKQFDVYNTLRSVNENIDAVEYMNTVLEQTPVFTKKELQENNQKLIDVVHKYKGNELIEISDEDAQLYESIEYILTHKKTLNNLNECLACKGVIVDYLKEHVEKTSSNNTDIDGLFNSTVSQTQKMYENLNDDERELVENMAKYGNDTETAFNGIKKEVSDCLSESLLNSDNYEEKERWKNVLEQINEMTYKEADGIDNIIKLYQIKNTIEN